MEPLAPDLYCADILTNADMSELAEADRTEPVRAYYRKEWLNGFDRADIDARAQIANGQFFPRPD